jgi:hypothetical protein
MASLNRVEMRLAGTDGDGGASFHVSVSFPVTEEQSSSRKETTSPAEHVMRPFAADKGSPSVWWSTRRSMLPTPTPDPEKEEEAERCS